MYVCSGTSACPPYHLAIVISGLSAELTLKTVKLASTKYYDNLPTSGNEVRHFFSCMYVCTVYMYVNNDAFVVFLKHTLIKISSMCMYMRTQTYFYVRVSLTIFTLTSPGGFTHHTQQIKT